MQLIRRNNFRTQIKIVKVRALYITCDARKVSVPLLSNLDLGLATLISSLNAIGKKS